MGTTSTDKKTTTPKTKKDVITQDKITPKTKNVTETDAITQDNITPKTKKDKTDVEAQVPPMTPNDLPQYKPFNDGHYFVIESSIGSFGKDIVKWLIHNQNVFSELTAMCVGAYEIVFNKIPKFMAFNDGHYFAIEAALGVLGKDIIEDMKYNQKAYIDLATLCMRRSGVQIEDSE